MKEKIIKHFCSITPLTDEECTLISESMVIRDLKKGDVLIKEGQIAVDTYFILEGLIREYVMIDGEERTTNFYTEGQWVISLNNFTPQARATHGLECAEDSILVVGNEKEAQEMFKRFPGFETISRVIMEVSEPLKPQT
jgi:CRP-like cAMP-binding protein